MQSLALALAHVDVHARGRVAALAVRHGVVVRGRRGRWGRTGPYLAPQRSVMGMAVGHCRREYLACSHVLWSHCQA